MATPIWDRLIGQPTVTDELSRAVHDAEQLRLGLPGPAMTHAWLIIGPPGSGRSTAASCFAASLACPEDGCGVCEICRTAPLGGHPDIDIVTTEAVNYAIDEARDLVRRSGMAPVSAPWHVIVIEDADRLRDDSVNVLLKALEEPPPHTVWVLCAPSVEDVLPTVLSRTRHVPLRTPSTQDIAQLLVDSYNVDIAMASFAARSSQGHIGRARGLATDEHARSRRQEVMRIPFQLHDIPSCFNAATNLLAAATEDADAITGPLEELENLNLLAQYGDGVEGVPKARLNRMMSSGKTDLDKRQKRRRTRTLRDQVDRALLDLLGLYRDVLVIQVEGDVDLINEELRPQLSQLAERSTPNDTGRRMKAISYARHQVVANVPPQLVLESMMVELKDPWVRAAVV